MYYLKSSNVIRMMYNVTSNYEMVVSIDLEKKLNHIEHLKERVIDMRENSLQNIK